MSPNHHNSENRGANTRDQVHPRPHFLKRAHRDWRVWLGVLLMLAMIITYIMTSDLSRTPHNPTQQKIPAANAP